MAAFDERSCRKCGDPLQPKDPARGRYANLCTTCRGATSVPSEPRADILKAEDFVNKAPGLKRACEALTKRAETLETAIRDRRLAHDRAKAALANFNETLRVVGAAARVLVDGGPGPEE